MQGVAGQARCDGFAPAATPVAVTTLAHGQPLGNPKSRCSFQAGQILPSNNSTTRMTRINPSPPLGAYPQLRLCGQAGSAPTSIRISTINNMVPIDMVMFSICGQLTASAPALNKVPFWISRPRCGTIQGNSSPLGRHGVKPCLCGARDSSAPTGMRADEATRGMCASDRARKLEFTALQGPKVRCITANNQLS